MSALDLRATPSLTPGTRLQVDQVTGEPVLLYPEGVLILNETARDIVERCDGHRSLAAIIESLASDYEAPVEDLTLDVLDCLGELIARNLLVLR